jgi:glycosyltransferase involved in cell wall biosynthesis
MRMFRNPRHLMPLADRGPLRVMFIITNMPVGGAETLLMELARRLDRNRFLPELCCLKRFDALGEVLSTEIPSFTGLLAHRWDIRVLWRLTRLLRQRRIDAVVTVGTGDKMFWGRLAAWFAGVPVICSALHCTGLPERVERLNRLLTPLTDAFIAVAEPQSRYLAKSEGCPADRIRVIPNGIDTARFQPKQPNESLQQKFGLTPETPVVGIVAALRPEKNHELLLRAAALVHERVPTAKYLIVGDGPRRASLEKLTEELSLSDAVRFLGTRRDVPEMMALFQVLALTSHMEANPVCLLEAMACEKPVVATDVGSISETVSDGQTGYLVPPGDVATLADRLVALLEDRQLAAAMGRSGREKVLARWSTERMVEGYQDLIGEIYASKCRPVASRIGGNTENASERGSWLGTPRKVR